MKSFKILFKILKYLPLFLIIPKVYSNVLEEKFICETHIENTTDIRYQNIANRLRIFADKSTDCNLSSDFHFCILDANDSSKCYQDKELLINNSTTQEILFDEHYANIDPLLVNTTIKLVIEQTISDSSTTTKAHLVIPTVDGNMTLASRVIDNISQPNFSTCEQGNNVSTYVDCVSRISYKSQILAAVLGANMICIRDGIYNQFLKNDHCQNISLINNVWNFRAALEKSVLAVITLYVITIGFQILSSLSGKGRNRQEEQWDVQRAVLIVIKVIFVLYLSIGLSSSEQDDSNTSYRINGIEEIILPLAFEIIDVLSFNTFSSFSEFQSQKNGFCNFSPISEYADYRFYMWDTLECKMLYYLGSNSILGKFNNIAKNLNITQNTSNMGNVNATEIQTIEHESVPTSLNHAGNLNLLTVLSYMLLIPNFQAHIVFILILLIVVILSFSLLLITGYIISILTIFLIGYISPILVITFLFKSTENIFFSSCRILFSCILLPVVLSAFVAIVFSVYDSYLQPNCLFKVASYNLTDFYEANDQVFRTFTIASNGDTECTNSIMYQLQEYFYGHNWDKYRFIFWTWNKIIVQRDLISNFFQLLVINVIFLIILQKIKEFVSRSFNIGDAF